MKVKFLKSHPKYGYFAGNEGDVQDPKELIEGGFAVPVPGKTEKATLPKEETAKRIAKPKN
jgi:hypothetical protein